MLSTALVSLLAYPARASEMGARGRQRVQTDLHLRTIPIGSRSRIGRGSSPATLMHPSCDEEFNGGNNSSGKNIGLPFVLPGLKLIIMRILKVTQSYYPFWKRAAHGQSKSACSGHGCSRASGDGSKRGPGIWTRHSRNCGTRFPADGDSSARRRCAMRVPAHATPISSAHMESGSRRILP